MRGCTSVDLADLQSVSLSLLSKHKVINLNQLVSNKLAIPYHIDYIFGTIEMLKKLIKFKLGGFSEWIDLSDHMPVICEIEE